MKLTAPMKLSSVAGVLATMTAVISGVAGFTIGPTNNIRPMTNFFIAHRSAIRGNGGLNMGESHETDSSIAAEPIDLEKEVSVVEKKVAVYLSSLQLDPEIADNVWAELVRKDGTNNTLGRWYDIGNVMHNEHPENLIKGTNVAQWDSGKLLMNAVQKYCGQEDAPGCKDLLTMLTTIDFALENYRSTNEASANVATKIRPDLEATSEAQNAEDEVNGYILNLVDGTQTTTQVWNELQGPNGKFDEWYDVGGDMIDEAPDGAQPIKLAKAGTIVQSTCSANNGQPVVPSYAGLMTILLTLDLAFANYQLWYT